MKYQKPNGTKTKFLLSNVDSKIFANIRFGFITGNFIIATATSKKSNEIICRYNSQLVNFSLNPFMTEAVII